MELAEKLEILTQSAKYDAACTSSGANRYGGNGLGNALPAGCCHSFSSDGRCISLLKVLFSNECIYDCKYCVNRRSNAILRTSFTVQELADLTIQFYRRNYIEGLFLSSGVVKNPDYTMEQMISVLQILRVKHKFNGYIHAKAIPGSSPELVHSLGLLADRLSVNIELPSEQSLNRLAPGKTRKAILSPMAQIHHRCEQNEHEMVRYHHAPRFAGAGQSTQMIIGASPETDYNILRLTESLYTRYALKRVFFSAYIPVGDDRHLPSARTEPPLLREHRLYQADWMLRKYHFKADEILSEQSQDFNPYLDPKCNWAIHNLHFFPVDINLASRDALLRVPGIGPTGARRIIANRRYGKLGLHELKRMGIVLKRAHYFIITKDSRPSFENNKEQLIHALVDPSIFSQNVEQLSFFSPEKHALNEKAESVVPFKAKNKLYLPQSGDCSSMKEAASEAVRCLAKAL